MTARECRSRKDLLRVPWCILVACLGDRRLAYLIAGEFADDYAAGEDEHPIADGGELLVIGAGAKDGGALIGGFGDRCEDLRSGADIHPLSGLIQQDEARGQLKPFRQQHFLLIAAAQRPEQKARVTRPDIEALRQTPSIAGQRASTQRPGAADLIEDGKAQIVDDIERRNSTRRLSIAGDQDAALGDGFGRGEIGDAQPLTVELDCAAIGGDRAVEHIDKIVITGADQTRETDDLAASQRRREIPYGAARKLANRDRSIVEAPRRRAHRLEIDMLSDDHADNLALAHRRRLECPGDTAIAQYGGAVGDGPDLVDIMR